MNAERLLQLYDRVSDAPDAVPRLRRFILDLAVRGKLVEQDPEDEPAADLLRKIEDEKVRLVKAGKIRKPKDLPPVTEPPYPLPKRWIWARMRQVTSDRGQKIPTDRFTYLDVTSIDKEAGVISDPKIVESSEAPSRARKITRKGDVIYSCVRPYLLNVALITDDFAPEPIASTAFAVLNGHGLLAPRYIWIVLRSPFMVACVEVNQRGQAYPAINDADFSLLPFPLPPLGEQHRIVAKVDELMALCDSLEAEREKREATRDRLTTTSLSRLTAPDVDEKQFKAHTDFAIKVLPELTTRPDQIKLLRRTILDLAVRGKLVEQDPTDEPASELLARISSKKEELRRLGVIKDRKAKTRERGELSYVAIPPGWSLTDLGQIAEKITDGAHKTPTYLEKGVPFVSVKDFSQGQLSLENTRFIPEAEHRTLFTRCDPRRGDILLARIGTLGKAVLVNTDVEFSLFVSVALIRFSHDFVNPQFLKIMLNSPFVEAEFESIKVGGATHTNKLNLGDLQTVRILLPPKSEQSRIVAKVGELMAVCDGVEQSLDGQRSDQQRLLEALMARALTGKAIKAA